MGDEQIGQTELLLQILEQVDDLRLDRNVERRDRLVAHDELRIDRQRARDADALALSARKFVRVAVGVVGLQADASSAAPARGRSASFPVAIPWIRSGSAMMSPTVMRGLSDAYGSWKMICISLRSAPQLGAVERA